MKSFIKLIMSGSFVLASGAYGAESSCEASLAAIDTSLETEAMAAIASVRAANVTQAEVSQAVVEKAAKVTLQIKIIGLVVPKAYAENEAEFEANRRHAQNVLLPRLSRIEMSLGSIDWNNNFPRHLKSLAKLYDVQDSEDDKAAILGLIMSRFSIPVESHYINLFREPELSPEFKNVLYVSLAKKFKRDPSWRPPLDKAYPEGIKMGV